MYILNGYRISRCLYILYAVLQRKPCNSLATNTFRRLQRLPKTITKSVRSKTNRLSTMNYTTYYKAVDKYSDDNDE